jgi:hypothetical protein
MTSWILRMPFAHALRILGTQPGVLDALPLVEVIGWKR